MLALIILGRSRNRIASLRSHQVRSGSQGRIAGNGNRIGGRRATGATVSIEKGISEVKVFKRKLSWGSLHPNPSPGLEPLELQTPKALNHKHYFLNVVEPERWSPSLTTLPPSTLN